MASIKTLSLLISALIFISAQAHPFLENRVLTSTSSGPSTLVSTTATQTSPQLVLLSTNGYMVGVCISGGTSITIAIYNNYGTAVGTGTSITSAAGSTFNSVSVSAIPQGFVVVYEQVLGFNTKIYYQTYTQDGVVLMAQAQVLTATMTSSAVGAMNPKVVYPGNGNFAVAYLVPQAITTPATAKGIYFTLIKSDTGSIQLAATLANEDTLSSNNHYPSIVSLLGGGFVLTFHNTVGPSSSQIYAKIYTSGGSVTKSSFAIAQSSTANYNPTVSASKSSLNFVIVWEGTVSTYSYVYSSTYSSSGTVVSGNNLISTDSKATKPVVTLTSSGLIVTAWIHTESGQTSVYLSSWDATYNTTYNEASYSTGNYPNPNNAITMITVGSGFFAAWSGASTSSSSLFGIYGYAFNNYGDKTPFSGDCFVSYNCNGTSTGCNYPARTCGTCATDTDCNKNDLCYANYCQASSYVTALRGFGGLLGFTTSAAALLWWIILLIVLGVVLCLVITGCIIYRLCRRSRTRTVVIKQTPPPVAFVAASPQQFGRGPYQ